MLFGCLDPSRPRRVRIMACLENLLGSKPPPLHQRAKCALAWRRRRLFVPFPCRHQVQLRREIFQQDSFSEKAWTFGKSCFLPFWISSTFTVRPLERGHLEEDYPFTKLFENKRFSSFFSKLTNKIQGSTMQLLKTGLKTLKPFELTWPLRKQPSNSWMNQLWNCTHT